MKIIPIVTAHYYNYFDVFLVVTFVEISGRFPEKFCKDLYSLYSDIKKFQTCGICQQ